MNTGKQMSKLTEARSVHIALATLLFASQITHSQAGSALGIGTFIPSIFRDSQSQLLLKQINCDQNDCITSPSHPSYHINNKHWHIISAPPEAAGVTTQKPQLTKSRLPFLDGFLWIVTGLDNQQYLYSEMTSNPEGQARELIPIKNCPMLYRADEDTVGSVTLCDDTQTLDTLLAARYCGYFSVLFRLNEDGVMMVTVHTIDGETFTLTIDEYRNWHSIFHEALKSSLITGPVDYVRSPAPASRSITPSMTEKVLLPENSQPKRGGEAPEDPAFFSKSKKSNKKKSRQVDDSGRSMTAVGEAFARFLHRSGDEPETSSQQSRPPENHGQAESGEQSPAARVEIDNLDTVTEFVRHGEPTVIAFDLDDTLITQDVVNEEPQQVQLHSNLAELVKRIRRQAGGKNARVIILTQNSEERFNDKVKTTDLNLDLFDDVVRTGQTPQKSDYKTDEDYKRAIAGAEEINSPPDKGKGIRYFLEKTRHPARHLILVDDNETHLDNFARECLQLNIRCTTIQFNGARSINIRYNQYLSKMFN
ncbi:hypothetical protein V5J37_000175 [Endozoicomonas sp. NE43]